MNERKNCIIIFDTKLKQYVDKSRSIEKIVPDYSRRKFLVTFDNGRSYEYNMSSINWLTNPSKLNPEDYLIYVQNKRYHHIQEILSFGEWIKIIFENGTIYSNQRENIKLVRNYKNDPEVKNFLSYLKNAVFILNDINEDNDFLQRELDNIDVSEETVLSQILFNKPIIFKEIRNNLIFPFATNESQIQAVQNALRSNISVIQGPPGTGKTQTILNLIANLIIRDQKIAVVSGNNEATRNIQEKLSQNNLFGIDAFLGNKQNIAEFFSRPQVYPDLNREKIPEHISDFSTIFHQARQIFRLQKQFAQINQKINEYSIEKKRYHNLCKNINFSLQNHLRKTLSSRNYLEISAYLEILTKKKHIGIIPRLRLIFSFKLKKSKNILKNLSDFIDLFHNQFYQTKLDELKSEQAKILETLTKPDTNHVIDQLEKLSLYLFKQYLKNYYENLPKIEFSIDNFRLHFDDFKKRYPIIYSTTHALHSCSGAFDSIYDYVIIDEASQVDLASATVAMACAKNIVFVGDLQQLPHVIPDNNKQALADLFRDYSFPEYLDYAKNSILQCICKKYKKSIPSVLLNEHYRCDPQIIQFCNKRFYQDKLLIQTDHEPTNGITIITTDPHFARKRTNERQADIILQEILPFLKDQDVGIIAPYRDQVKLITKKVNNPNILIDTIHKFQGKERNTIILSTVSNKIVLSEDNENSDFLNNENLINVAISRAKKKLYVIASKELLEQDGSLFKDLSQYISYYGESSEIKQSTTYSVFDLLYQEYAPVLNQLKAKLLSISEFPSENIIATLLKKICHCGQYGNLSFTTNYPLHKLIPVDQLKDSEDQAFVNNINSHCDFLLFQTLDKSIRLVIEVDGSHHDNLIQKIRDERKDRILRNFEIPVLRIRTTEINCEEKIIQALKTKSD